MVHVKLWFSSGRIYIRSELCLISIVKIIARTFWIGDYQIVFKGQPKLSARNWRPRRIMYSASFPHPTFPLPKPLKVS